MPPGIGRPDYAEDGMPKSGNPPPAWVIEVKTEEDIAGMRAAGKVARWVRGQCGRSVRHRQGRARRSFETHGSLSSSTVAAAGSRCTPRCLHVYLAFILCMLIPARCCFLQQAKRAVTESGEISVVRFQGSGTQMGTPNAVLSKHMIEPFVFSPRIVACWSSCSLLTAFARRCFRRREVLDLAGKAVKIGATTDDVDRACHEAAVERGAYPSPLNYFGFPKRYVCACASCRCVLGVFWLNFGPVEKKAGR